MSLPSLAALRTARRIVTPREIKATYSSDVKTINTNVSEISTFNEENSSLYFDEASEMDAIRSRGFLKYNYVYNPPKEIEETIKDTAKQIGLKIDAINRWQDTEITDFNIKEKLLQKVGEMTKHFVPNSRLHQITTLSNLIEFYSQPIKNITKYAELARSNDIPKNIAIRENPVRFHPNDKEQVHEGISPFPGRGGQVFGLRNKRLYRQFKPKSDWFDFEDQSFDYEDITKGLPWDPEMAKKMDSSTDKKFFVNKVTKI